MITLHYNVLFYSRVFNRLQSGLIKDAPDSIDESDNQKKCWSALAKKIAIGLRQHDNPSFTGGQF